jgi:hypothetical protein
MDGFNRYTSEGYGWLSLDGRVPGSETHVVRTWKPLGGWVGKAVGGSVGGEGDGWVEGWRKAVGGSKDGGRRWGSSPET